jgi:hypothetical protein
MRAVDRAVGNPRSTLTPFGKTRLAYLSNCPHDCPCDGPKQRVRRQRQPIRSIEEAENSEGFTRKIEVGREAIRLDTMEVATRAGHGCYASRRHHSARRRDDADHDPRERV